MKNKATKATLTLDDGSAPIELPILSGTLGNDVIDIRNLGKHGIFTYDPGFMSTAACNSRSEVRGGAAFTIELSRNGECALVLKRSVPSREWWCTPRR